ncbi:hypothetical protein [Methylomonas methanica]|nr:hypothetical protein [Methylomonas methanica]
MILFTSVLVTTFVLLTIISFLALSWFKKRKQHQQLETLLNEIKERQNSRKNKLSRKFARQFDMAEKDAQEISDKLISAEKLFLQQYIDQLLKQKPSDVVYDQLCELLDHYLISLPNQNKETSQNKSQHTSSQEELTSSTPEPASTENTEAISEPDWGDVFD